MLYSNFLENPSCKLRIARCYEHEVKLHISIFDKLAELFLGHLLANSVEMLEHEEFYE